MFFSRTRFLRSVYFRHNSFYFVRGSLLWVKKMENCFFSASAVRCSCVLERPINNGVHFYVVYIRGRVCS